jgi:hypothetical protein
VWIASTSRPPLLHNRCCTRRQSGPSAESPRFRDLLGKAGEPAGSRTPNPQIKSRFPTNVDHSRPRKIGVGCPTVMPITVDHGRLSRNPLHNVAQARAARSAPASLLAPDCPEPDLGTRSRTKRLACAPSKVRSQSTHLRMLDQDVGSVGSDESWAERGAEARVKAAKRRAQLGMHSSGSLL